MAPKTVLLIDDNPIDLMINNKTIERYDPDALVCLAKSAKEALSILESGECTPACVLLDIKMPEMDGFQFLEALSKSKLEPKFNVHMLSSSIDPADIENADKNPMVRSYIEKPLNIEKLKAIKL